MPDKNKRFYDIGTPNKRNEKGLPRGKPFCSLELREKLFLPFGFFGSHVVVLIVVLGGAFKGVIGFQ